MTSTPAILVTYTTLRELSAAELTLIPPEEMQRVTEIGAPRRQQEYLCGRALLRNTLERWTGEPAASHRLTATERGKPECIDGPALSITHSGNLVACAVTDSGDIGIDLEVPKRSRRTTDIARSYFSSEEASWLATQPADRFHMLWVLKEACLKSIGLGLDSLDRFRFKVLPPKIEATIEDDSIQSLGLYAMGEALLALASRHFSLQEVRFECWNPAAESPVTGSGFRAIAKTNDVAG
jgi:4'-phosphopantetheinyl transferase